MQQISVGQLFEDNREKLKLTHVSGNLDTPIKAADESVWPADLVGHMNQMHLNRVQVVGAAEIAWAARQPPERMRGRMDEIATVRPPAIIMADGCEVSDGTARMSAETGVAVFTTPSTSASVIDLLRLYLARALAERTTLHGVFMDVLGLGVLITGESGAGKSELALELITRGHGLVADDIVEVFRVAPDTLEGRCPELLMDFLEVRGLGLINIRTIFGETARRRKMRLRLIVHLQKPSPGVPEATRLPLDDQTQVVIGVPIRRVVLPVAAGRNLSVLLEAAVRTTVLMLRGIDANKEFIDRQRRAIDGQSP
jgi:HPr kinase/phosphorylase